MAVTPRPGDIVRLDTKTNIYSNSEARKADMYVGHIKSGVPVLVLAVVEVKPLWWSASYTTVFVTTQALTGWIIMPQYATELWAELLTRCRSKGSAP